MSKILFTGTNPENYQHLGGLIHFPTIAIKKASIDKETEKKILGKIKEYHYVLLTSRFAVDYFDQWLKAHGLSLKNLTGVEYLVIGHFTADILRTHDCEPSLVSGVETSEGMLEAITDVYDVKDKDILFPRSSISNPYLQDHLTKLGARVDVVTIYENTKPAKKALPSENISSIVFTSPSTVKNFLEDYGQIPDNWEILSKGPLTQKLLEEKGYTSKVIAHE